MSSELLVNTGPRETRAALLENGVLTEIHIERASRRGLVGNVYKGRVSRVLPGMQAAFIDVGLERTAFLHVADIALVRPDDTVVSLPLVDDIRRLVSQGDELLVQVVKDPMGTKGARLTTFVALPSRYLVFMPRGEGIGVSARIEDDATRQRLKAAIAAVLPPQAVGGYIVRTAAQTADAAGLREDVAYLEKLWRHVRTVSARVEAGTIVHADLPLALRVLRDELVPEVTRVLVDSPTELVGMQEFARTFLPDSPVPIELYSGQRPLFDLHGVEEELVRALDRKVSLKSGGHLIIDQTEAMTTIDVNHRWLCRAPKSRGNDLSHQPGSGGRDRPTAAAAQFGRHHHHRFHRHGRRRAPSSGAAGAGAGADRGSCADPYRESLASRAGGDDPQAHPREPRAPAVQGLSGLRRPRLCEDP